MKNYRTPRTLAESEFTSGYRQIELNQRADSALGIVFALALFALIGVILAFGV